MSRFFRNTTAPPPAESSNPSSNANDLENQFILRIPPHIAEKLREAIRNDPNLQNRLSIKLESGRNSVNQSALRRGTVTLDGVTLSAKLVDLPTIIESQKTIDRKTFYKTADVCQLLICKEGDPSDEDDEPDPSETARKSTLVLDQNKVEKKYLYPHGVCPPLKNCRKRRFRKVLKKNYVEAPEIEKEVKRLFRVDNEAVDVKWELVTEEELNASKSSDMAASSAAMSAGPSLSANDSMTSYGGAIDESDLFGAVSDIDDDEQNVDIDSEEDNSMFEKSQPSSSVPLVTQFSKEMFQPTTAASQQATGENKVAVKLDQLRSEISQLQRRKEELLMNINHCGNQALLLRLRESLHQVETDLKSREIEIDAFSMFH